MLLFFSLFNFYSQDIVLHVLYFQPAMEDMETPKTRLHTHSGLSAQEDGGGVAAPSQSTKVKINAIIYISERLLPIPSLCVLRLKGEFALFLFRRHREFTLGQSQNSD